MKHLSNQQRRIEIDCFLQLYQKRLICMQIHTAQARHCNFLPCGGAGTGAQQNAKDFLKRFGRIPIFICKSSLVEIKEFHLDLCQAMQASSCEMQIFFRVGALPTTNDFWSNQESLDPLSYRCVCIG